MSDLPPSLPPPRGPASASRKRKGLPKSVVFGVAVAVVGVIVLRATKEDDGSTASSPSSGVSAPFSNTVCDKSGYSGQFTNTGSTTFSGHLWAVALRRGTVVARDEEVEIGIAPGETVSVQFVWSVDAVDSCRIERVSQG